MVLEVPSRWRFEVPGRTRPRATNPSSITGCRAADILAALRVGYANASAVSSPEKNWEVWGKRKGKDQGRRGGRPLPVNALGMDDEHDDDEVSRRPNPRPAKTALGYAWPGVVSKHIEHWATRPDARGSTPTMTLSTRAPSTITSDPLRRVTTTRLWPAWSRGAVARVQIDRPGVEDLLAKAQAMVANSPVNVNKPGEVRAYVTAAMDETEAVILEESTKKSNLEAIRELGGRGGRAMRHVRGRDRAAPAAAAQGVLKPGKHPAAVRAKTSST